MLFFYCLLFTELFNDKAPVDYAILLMVDSFADAVVAGIGIAVTADTANGVHISMTGGYVGIKERGISGVSESCPALGTVIEHAVFLCAAYLIPLNPNAALLRRQREGRSAQELDFEPVVVVVADMVAVLIQRTDRIGVVVAGYNIPVNYGS